MGLIFGPQGGDAQALGGFVEGVVVLDGFGAFAELLHLGLEGGAGGLQLDLGGGLALLRHSGGDGQQSEGGGE
ncbi:hypothetical protein D3C75_1210630 [compost metagenome]